MATKVIIHKVSAEKPPQAPKRKRSRIKKKQIPVFNEGLRDTLANISPSIIAAAFAREHVLSRCH
jgi:hypothetical protein